MTRTSGRTGRRPSHPGSAPLSVLLAAIVLLGGATSGFAALPPVPVPPENPITEPKRVLGKILFWEEQVSSDNTVACGTCHLPGFAGADPRLATHPGLDELFGTDDDVIGSPGIARRDSNNEPIADPLFGFDPQVTGRAAQSYFGSMYASDLFWDGRAGSTFLDPLDGVTVRIATGGGFESQAVAPILSDVEMAHEARNWSDVTDKLATVVPMALASDLPGDLAAALLVDPTYPDLFDAAFGDPAITPTRIAFAIATYERTLVPDQSPWDLFVAGDSSAMTAQQINGWNIFRNNTVCDNCHGPPLFTDNLYHNIGLRPAAEDPGRQDTTGNPNDFGRFRTPSLRNVGLKASMMHVGWLTDVQDVIDFYNAPEFPEIGPNGHTQFTADQTGIPTMGGGTVPYIDLNLPVQGPGGIPLQVPVIDFIANALTDPRVANEEFPFDRPTLASEATTGAPIRSAPFHLVRNAPNPFRSSTTIEYSISSRAPVGLRVFDVTGRLVRVLEAGIPHGPGTYLATWDGHAGSGVPAASGVYFYVIDVDGVRESRPMVLVK